MLRGLGLGLGLTGLYATAGAKAAKAAAGVYKETTRYIPVYDYQAQFDLAENSAPGNFALSVSGTNGGTGPNVTFEGSLQALTYYEKGKPVRSVKLELFYKDGAKQTFYAELAAGTPQGRNVSATASGPNGFQMNAEEMRNAGLTKVLATLSAVAAARAEEAICGKKRPKARSPQMSGPLPEP